MFKFSRGKVLLTGRMQELLFFMEAPNVVSSLGMSMPKVSISIDPFFLSIGCSGPSVPPELANNAHITAHLALPRLNTCNGRLV